jgi:CDP-diacylglycerol--serine O-phosphatidyltransferase
MRRGAHRLVVLLRALAALLFLLGFLMVSTWRYYSFKGIGMNKAYSPLIIILVGGFVYGMFNYSQWLLLAMSSTYVASGIVIRIGGVLRRRLRHAPPPAPAEHPVG